MMIKQSSDFVMTAGTTDLCKIPTGTKDFMKNGIYIFESYSLYSTNCNYPVGGRFVAIDSIKS